MIDVNLAGLNQMIGLFDSDLSAHHISDKTNKLTKEEGAAIDEINACFDSFDNYCTNINNLYSATSSYLHKVSYNINLCEEGNGG